MATNEKKRMHETGEVKIYVALYNIYLQFFSLDFISSKFLELNAILRCGSAASRLLKSWVRIPPNVWMFVCCECCVLSGSGLGFDLITRPEEYYRL